MGEAKRRREWRIERTACGLPVPRPGRCPACGSKRIIHLSAKQIAALDCEHGTCLDCRALWEAFPPMMVEDPVCAEPCDNCAFRPGSPEQEDPEQWKELVGSLRPDGDGWFSGRFYCHKGVPIDQAKGPGNFLFPMRAIDAPDAPEATAYDVSKMRTCSGFLRMFWELNAKRERAAAQEKSDA